MISDNFRRVPVEQVRDCFAWQDESIPKKQYELCVRGELEAFKAGKPMPLFDEVIKVWRRIHGKSVLDVGASSGYYKEVLRLRGFEPKYLAVDFSPSFKRLAEKLWPGIAFEIGDACALRQADNSFEVVLHSGVLLHLKEYGRAINEAARVASRYVIFHRIPVNRGLEPTSYWVKDAYDVPCLELHFNEKDLVGRFHQAGLEVLSAAVIPNSEQKIFLCEKALPEPYASNKNV